MKLKSGIIRIATCAFALCLFVPAPAYADLIIDADPIDDVVATEDQQEDGTQDGTSQDIKNDDQAKPDANEFPRELTQEEYDQLSEYIHTHYKGIHYDEHGNMVDENGVYVLDEEAFVIDERGGWGQWPPEDDIDSPIDAVSYAWRHYTLAIVIAVAVAAAILIFRLRRRKR